MKFIKKISFYIVLLVEMQSILVQTAEESKAIDGQSACIIDNFTRKRKFEYQEIDVTDNDITTKIQKKIEPNDDVYNIDEIVKKYPNFVEGFDLLIEKDKGINTFHDYLLKNLNLKTNTDQDDSQDDSEDDDLMPLFGVLIEQVEDEMLKSLEPLFVQSIIKLLSQGTVEIDKIKDPIFQYVIKNKDGFLQYPLKEWIDTIRNDNFNLLMIAAKSNNLSIAKMLVNSGANLNSINNIGNTALMIAAESNNLPVAKMLIASDANLNSINNIGNTALMTAACNNKRSIVKMLISADADFNMQNNDGNSALQLAVINGHENIVNVLIDAQANLNFINNKGLTALMIAASQNKISIVQMLIESGVDLNFVNSEGMTALMIAAYENKTSIIHILIGANSNINLQNNNGDSVLHLVINNDYDYYYNDIIEILINAGVNLNLVNNSGMTPLDKSILLGRTDITNILLHGSAHIEVEHL